MLTPANFDKDNAAEPMHLRCTRYTRKPCVLFPAASYSPPPPTIPSKSTFIFLTLMLEMSFMQTKGIFQAIRHVISILDWNKTLDW